MITVLRLGHRIHRDKRITTHCSLVARAFGADEILIDTKDKKLEETIKSTCDRFGNNFEIKTGIDSKKIFKNWDGIIIHLTMYGEKFEKIIKKVDVNKDILIVIGAEKVPPWIYEKSTYNVSIGNQPHSEVAALAIFLDRLHYGEWINKKFSGKMQIIPSKSGKKVISRDK